MDYFIWDNLKSRNIDFLGQVVGCRKVNREGKEKEKKKRRCTPTRPCYVVIVIIA
jgi:hypothetical protein